jgi:hypothetical protein
MQLVNGFAAQNIQCKEENTIMNGSSLETRIRRFYFTVKQGVRSINEAGSFGSKRTGFMCALFVCGTQEEALGRIIALALLYPGRWVLTFLSALPSTAQCIPLCCACSILESTGLHEGPSICFCFACPHYLTAMHLVQ